MTLSRTEVEKIRGHLLVKGWPTKKIAEKFEVGRSAVTQVISGDSVSSRIQDFIADEIGFWPWERKRGESRPD